MKRFVWIVMLLLVFAGAVFAQDDDVVLEEDIERPDWQQMELVDANTGETFTLGDFYGQTVFVEPMATWCTNCRSQLRNVREAIELLTEEEIEDVVFIALSVETNLSSESLADYTAAQDFDWTFAVMSEELLIALVDEFGRAIANPPSTPHFIIRKDGTYTEVETGIETSDEIVEQLLLAVEESAPTLPPSDDEEMSEEEDEVMIPADVEWADWQLIELTDAATGETFTLADFYGQTVFVEPMATWCSNCRSQLQNVRAAIEQLEADGVEDVVFIALSVETNLSAEALAEYSAIQGFDWTFAVMSPDMLRALVDEFGRTISNPPSTPHFVIRPDATFTDVSTGIKNSSAIIEQIVNEAS